METKKDIRTRALHRRQALRAEVREAYGREITRLAAAHPLFLRAREIYGYAAFRGEVSTVDLLQTAWKLGKRVALPRVEGPEKMHFYYVEDLRELEPGYQGILEPRRTQKKAEHSPLPDSVNQPPVQSTSDTGCPDGAGKENAVLVLVPGAAFDNLGNRIGYGKGFYDRYLAAHPQYHRMGLAFSCQCDILIPADSHDIRMEEIVTEKGWMMPC